jgi:nitrite reductase (NAD(P)H)
VSKGRLLRCIEGGECVSIGDLKTETKVGTGCGGCMPLVSGIKLIIKPEHGQPMLGLTTQITNIFNAEMKKAGHELDNNLCRHFAMSRADLFSIVRVKKFRNFTQIMQELSVSKDSIGCEVCKPAIGSILSSL